MRLFSGIVVLLGITIACTNTKKTPENILPKQKMQSVLWDMIQADRFSVLFVAKDSAKKNLQTENLKSYEKVFQIHQISKDEFVKSYKYYLTRPDLAKLIFDSIATKAERERANVYKTTPAQ
jgi:hypothetical protein